MEPAASSSSSTVSSSIVTPSSCCLSCSLRPIVIDGSNVAILHGNRDVFSCKGIQICVDWFRNRGHKEITVFVPMWRKEPSRADAPIADQQILFELESEGFISYTPSRSVNGRRIVCHDDRFILRLAAENGGVIVSNDNYRDLAKESPEFQKVIENHLLMFTIVGDKFMPPDDPLGRNGPSLDKFLMKSKVASSCEHVTVTRTPSGNSTVQCQGHSSTQPPACPYNKKCTFGNKCKYYHPERGNQPVKSVADRMAEQARIQLQDRKARSMEVTEVAERMKACHTASLPPTLHVTGGDFGKRKALARTKSVMPSGHFGGQFQSPGATVQTGQAGHDLMVRANAVKSNLLHSGALMGSPHLNKNLPSTSRFASASCAELLGHLTPSNDSAEHLNLGKRFSDPVKAGSQDSVMTCNSFSLSEQGSPDSAIHHMQSSSHPPSHLLGQSALHHQQLQQSHSLNTSSNANNSQHAKLTRCLTLNPYSQCGFQSPSTAMDRGHSSCSPSTHTSLVRHSTLQEASDFATGWTTSGLVQAPIGSHLQHRSPVPGSGGPGPGPIQPPIGCHRQQSLRRMRSEPDSSPPASSCSSFSVHSTTSTSSSNVPSAAGGTGNLLNQAREVLRSVSCDGSFNSAFGDLILMSINEDGSLTAELTVDFKHCNSHGLIHEAFISGLMTIVSSLSLHIPLGIDCSSCGPAISATNYSNCCSCGSPVELLVNYHSLAKKGDVILVRCDVHSKSDSLTYLITDLINKSNENKLVARGLHLISLNP